MDSHDRLDHQRHAPEHHIASLGMYFGVFFALLILTVVTVAVSRIDLGAMNTPVAMLIAIVKAALVILFFMHVIQSTRLTWVVVISAFLWLAVLFGLTFADYLTRLWPI